MNKDDIIHIEFDGGQKKPVYFRSIEKGGKIFVRGILFGAMTFRMSDGVCATDRRWHICDEDLSKIRALAKKKEIKYNARKRKTHTEYVSKPKKPKKKDLDPRNRTLFPVSSGWLKSFDEDK